MSQPNLYFTFVDVDFSFSDFSNLQCTRLPPVQGKELFMTEISWVLLVSVVRFLLERGG